MGLSGTLWGYVTIMQIVVDGLVGSASTGVTGFFSGSALKEICWNLQARELPRRVHTPCDHSEPLQQNHQGAWGSQWLEQNLIRGHALLELRSSNCYWYAGEDAPELGLIALWL